MGVDCKSTGFPTLVRIQPGPFYFFRREPNCFTTTLSFILRKTKHIRECRESFMQQHTFYVSRFFGVFIKLFWWNSQVVRLWFAKSVLSSSNLDFTFIKTGKLSWFNLASSSLTLVFGLRVFSPLPQRSPCFCDSNQKGQRVQPSSGIEPLTFGLQDRYSTN
jgi:hypothetical protein